MNYEYYAINIHRGHSINTYEAAKPYQLSTEHQLSKNTNIEIIINNNNSYMPMHMHDYLDTVITYYKN